jgi:hypothetical protein
MAPLYEPESQTLRPLCARALKRIFLLCDKDKARLAGGGVLGLPGFAETCCCGQLSWQSGMLGQVRSV